MAMRRLSYGALTVALILAAGATVLAVKRSSSTERAADSEASSRDPLREVDPIDPNAGGEVPADAVGGVAGAEPTPGCNAVGGLDDQFAFGSVYRGDAVRFDRPVQLRQFAMELKFMGTTNLYFSLHRRDETDGLFYRFLPNDIVITATGPGDGPTDPTEYFSPDPFNPPLNLPPGEYAFGVGWGSEVAVRFGRAAEFDPEFIPGVGVMLGTVNQPVPPPIDPTNQGVFLTYNTAFGLYSMEICLVPHPGACCSAATTSCAEVLQSQCDGPGDYFAGQFTSCDDVICRFGACCSDCGECDTDLTFTRQACAENGGTWNYDVACPAMDMDILCPLTTGACCKEEFEGTTCTELCEDQCIVEGGTYQGDLSTCDPDPCVGACCFNGGCLNVTETVCSDLNGAFRGVRTECETLEPGDECGGACCYALSPNDDKTFDACTVVSSRRSCRPGVFPVSAYLGDRTVCPQDPSDPVDGCGTFNESASEYRACCLPNGTCIHTTKEFCEESWVNGGFNENVFVCNPDLCETQACCFPDGSCKRLTSVGCTALGGTVNASATCTEGLCTPTGACCGRLASDPCEVLTEEACVAQDGVYQGDKTNCSTPAETCVGFGACCRPDGTCLGDVTLAECDILAGPMRFQGEGSTCDDVAGACSDFRACCTVAGDCVLATMSECGAINGVFNRDAETCAPDTCPAGACCIAEEGSCLRKREGECQTPDRYLGTGSVCETGVCIRGACCHADGNCDPTQQIELDCDEADDIFTPNVTCDELDPPCSAVGACCFISGICAQLRPEECADLEGIYQQAGLGCSPGLCNVGACCSPDYVCENDQFDTSCRGQGADYEFFLGDICEIDRPCDPLGACCLFDICTQETQFQCEVQDGGAYLGDGVECGEDSCPTGACCRPAGGGFFTCSNAVYESECQAEGEEFHANTDCVDRPCDPTGACCLLDDMDNAFCEIRPQLLCEPEGTYNGNDTTCDMCGTCSPNTILSISPDNCTYDVRTPHEPTDRTMGLNTSVIELTLDCDVSILEPPDLPLSFDPVLPGQPAVVDVTPTGPNSVTVTLNHSIQPGAWTCVGQRTGGNSMCIGALPGDVDKDGTSLAFMLVNDQLVDGDLLALLDALTGASAPLPLEQCDLDRDGTCAFPDLVLLIDMLEGNSDFAVWDQVSLPECPSLVIP